MSEFLKPQSPLQHKDGAYFYPLTTADQVILDDGSRLNSVIENMVYASEERQEDAITNLFADKAMTIPAFPRTKVKAVSDDNGVGLNALLDAKQEKHIATTVTLFATAWVNNQQTVNLNVVGSNSTVIVVASPQNFDTYVAEGIYCSGQSEGQLTFTCTSVPNIDLVANIMILN